MSSQDEEVYEYEGERIELDHLAKTVHYEVRFDREVKPEMPLKDSYADYREK